ncbi:hypothetical protein BC629DRAFT_1525401 [Irpex lacteus]|nr:hypothetical protein BC629DRAFT_1525401 [Irpex lacteus]
MLTALTSTILETSLIAEVAVGLLATDSAPSMPKGGFWAAFPRGCIPDQHRLRSRSKGTSELCTRQPFQREAAIP